MKKSENKSLINASKNNLSSLLTVSKGGTFHIADKYPLDFVENSNSLSLFEKTLLLERAYLLAILKALLDKLRFSVMELGEKPPCIGIMLPSEGIPFMNSILFKADKDPSLNPKGFFGLKVMPTIGSSLSPEALHNLGELDFQKIEETASKEFFTEFGQYWGEQLKEIVRKEKEKINE